ncbi:MAG TPA: hypothetical protein VIB79_23180, partial [Candidatus Binatia bacterium]
PDGFHRVSYRLVKARDHRLAISADIDAQVAELFHFVEQKLVQFEQWVVEGCTHANLFGEARKRQKLLEIGIRMDVAIDRSPEQLVFNPRIDFSISGLSLSIW